MVQEAAGYRGKGSRIKKTWIPRGVVGRSATRYLLNLAYASSDRYVLCN